VNVAWFAALLLFTGAVLVSLYSVWTSSARPDPMTGHVVCLPGRHGSCSYLTANECFVVSALAGIGLLFFIPAYSLRGRWNMLPESVTGPDYENIRATYKDK
jgi:hypothetical protein